MSRLAIYAGWKHGTSMSAVCEWIDRRSAFAWLNDGDAAIMRNGGDDPSCRQASRCIRLCKGAKMSRDDRGGNGGHGGRKRYLPALVIWLAFETVAVGLWLGLGNAFYLFNFTYIGTCLGVGLALFTRGWKHARRFVMFAVGLYMLVYLGFIQGENMQIEGFWYYLLLGVLEGATIHYLIAKIAGPVLFGRGWCGYACWTAAFLELLPWKKSPGRKSKLGAVRYVVCVASLVVVAAGLAFGLIDEHVMFVAFIVGNAAYYAVGIALAAALHDNRAFCKYVCPVGVLMKPAAHISLMHVTCDHAKCVECGACLRACPMDVDVLDDSRSRRNATECILCLECVKACPKGALKL